MKKIISVFLFVLLIFTTGCSAVKNSNQTTNNPAPAPASGNTIKPDEPNNVPDNTTSTDQSDGTSKPPLAVNIYMIALEDNGKSGKKIDTGDSIIPVKRLISDSESPLKNTLTLLFSLKDRFYGESGLYNPLYQSDLKVASAKIENGIATINLSGRLVLGGVMDGPRVKAQVTETALQFSTIKEAKIFINDKTIDEALSLK
jgi:hypothetical protein